MTIQKKSMVGNLKSEKKAAIATGSGVKKTKVESMKKVDSTKKLLR